MSVRPPQTVIDRLSSLSSLGDAGPERRSPGHRRQVSESSETTGLVQRCVIVQKDQHGFGFTVSGDRIVLVQSVRPGGAAMRAGVQEGDRIVKVNGTMVANSSHLEVVKLIKSGAYVALTLLGSPPTSVGLSGLQQDLSPAGVPRSTQMSPVPPPPPPLPPPQRITGPKPLQDPEVQKHATQILRKMLQQEETELQSLCDVYSQNSSAVLEEQIEGARRRVHQLQLKIQQETSVAVDPMRMRSESSPANCRGRLSLDSQDGDSGLDSGTERIPSISESSLNRNSVLSDPGLDSPRTSPIISMKIYQHRRQGSDTPFTPGMEMGLDRSPRSLIIGPEEDYDPGYYVTECDGLFQDLEKLKSRPAHLCVFLRYIFSQADPNPLLFYLCADVCQQMGPKDARALGKDIWNIFLEKNAPLRVKAPDSSLAEIDARLRGADDIRGALSEAQDALLSEIQEQLQDYRTKRTMGLGGLYGENDLLDLDTDAQKERQVAEKQIAQLREILSKYEEDRSSPMDFALSTYMNYAGLKVRESRSSSSSEKSQTFPDKDKWLPFFPKVKKSSNAKKDRDSAEDKKRNPILKYIGKPKSSSQSTFHVPLSPGEVKPGNVRNIIQHFENNQHYDPQELVMQRLSTGSFPEDLLDSDSARLEVKLGRSESLKGREEMKRARKADNVPRSRSDVDMDAAAEATRLHQSASSSTSSLSTRSLENPTPPYTPKMGRRSIESPNLGLGGDVLLPHLQEDDLGQLSDLEPEPDSQNWQHTVGREVAPSLPQRERSRQEVIHELFVTEASHLRILRVLDLIFYQRMKKENLLSQDELWLLFPNLSELIEIHNSLSESMKRLREEGPVVGEISDLMLSRFDGSAGEEIQQEAAKFCSYQSFALELIKTKQRKETRFNLFMQEAESSPQCRRLQLKDLIVSQMQRLTKYPLLLENIVKYTDNDTSEHTKLCRCRDRCREILKYVNEAVKQAENQHRLIVYQKRLDATSLERTSNPLAAEFKNLDLTTRRMIHEGPLTWRIAKDKTTDLHVLLLEDLLVLLQKQDEKLVLKCHSKTTLGSSDTKQTFSPVIKLNSVLVRSVATDKRALFVICTSELGPQIYELVALTSSEKNTWKELVEEAAKSAMRNASCASKRRLPEMPSHGPPPVSVVLQDAGVPPILSAGDSSGPETEEVPAMDDNPALFLDKGKQPVLLEEPEVEGSKEDEAVSTPTQPEEEEEEEAATPLAEAKGFAGHLPFQHPVFTERLADSALEDVENLRHLILQSVLPHRDSGTERGWDPAAEADEDLTPTPSVAGGGALHTWDSANVARSTDLHASEGWHPPGARRDSAGHLGGSSSESCRTEDPRCCPSSRSMARTSPCSGEGQQGESEQTVEPHQLETHGIQEEHGPCGTGSLKVVRKAEVVGSNDVLLLPDSGQSETELQEVGGGTNLDGNYFYVALPSCPTESFPDELALPANYEERAASLPCPNTHQQQNPEDPPYLCKTADCSSLADTPVSSVVIQDVDMIFRTIEQLTQKLNRLKEVEEAHRELLKSLGSAQLGRDEALPETDRRKDSHPSHEGTRASFYLNSIYSMSASEDGLTDPPEEALRL
ncbi:rho guanine nucleotide exchange factor 11 isoform X3 [Rhinatrema bivittatum]|uniref:rho guanine nucleotide exchange factor 11 isoform X3 n=1 Tax=Rhinatrema bivittatum TaxID=194408 RepID=UPI00112965A7|nr:rho guanine nucleotide exchange factor 11 isoform X3 [Rhinatrema bivittatum]